MPEKQQKLGLYLWQLKESKTFNHTLYHKDEKMNLQNKRITRVLIIALLLMIFIVIILYLSANMINTNPRQKSSGIFINMPIVWRIRASEDIVSSPAADGKTIYYRTTKFVYALDGQTRKEIWKYSSPISDTLALPPYIIKPYLIIPEKDSRITVLSQETGNLIWQSASPNSEFTIPENLPIENVSSVENIVLVNRFNWNLTAYDINNGNILWEHELQGRTNPYIAINNKTIFLGVGQQLVALESDTGRIVWKVDLPGYVGNIFFDEYINSVIVANVDGLNLLFVDPKTGNLIARKGLNISSEFGVDCVVEDEDSLIVAADGLSYISQVTGEEKWHVNDVGHLECPTILDGKLFVRNTDTVLFAFDTKTGVSLGEMTVGKNTPMAHEPDRGPTSLNNLIIIPINDNELIAYRP